MGLFVVSAIPGAGAEPGNEPADSEACFRIVPPERITRVTDADWTHGETLLSVVDRNGGKVHHLDTRGQRAGHLHRPGPPPRGVNEPLAVEGTADGLVVQDDLYRFLWLDAEGEVQRVADVQRRGAVLQFALDGRNGLFAFGRWWEEQPTDGFFRIDLTGEAPEFRLLHAVPRHGPGRRFYSLLRPAFAVVSGHVHALRFDRDVGLFRITGGSIEPLEAFPRRFRALPSLPRERGPEAATAVFRALERTRAVSHLVGSRDRLFLVTRQPETRSGGGGAGTHWEVHRIDPERDRLESSLPLPTSAPHVRLVPGDSWWAVLEQDSMTGVGNRPLASILFLPAAWFFGDGPLEGEEPVRCEFREAGS